MRAAPLKIVETLRARAGRGAPTARGSAQGGAVRLLADRVGHVRFCPADVYRCLQMSTNEDISRPPEGRHMLSNVNADVHAPVDGCSRMLTKADVSHPSPGVRGAGPASRGTRAAREKPRKAKLHLGFCLGRPWLSLAFCAGRSQGKPIEAKESQGSRDRKWRPAEGTPARRYSAAFTSKPRAVRSALSCSAIRNASSSAWLPFRRGSQCVW